MTSSVDLELSALIQLFPSGLRDLIQAELTRGNRIIEHGAGHPAPPAGAMIKFAEDVATDLPEGLTAYARNSSLHHTEISDDERRFWILTAPHAQAPVPDMDAIRSAHGNSMETTPVAPQTPGTIRMDIRGEMLVYQEQDRRTDIVWTWSKGNRLHPSTISPWWYPAERRSVAMSEEERAVVLDRFIRFAQLNIASDIIIED